MLFELQPIGAARSIRRCAGRLKIHYDHADGDLNDDGSRGRRRRRHREHAGDLAAGERRAIRSCASASVLTVEIDEAEADLTGFSRYALAY